MTNRLKELVETAIERLKAFEPPEGYHLAFSGGKDSVVVKALADMAKVLYHAVYRVTGIDPPELFYFIRDKYPDVEMEYPRYSDGRRITMWNLIENKLMPPTRLARYCCEYLKESAGDGHLTITGVRWAESNNRSENQGIATIMKAGKKFSKEMGLHENENFRYSNRGGVVLVNDNSESRRMIEQCYKREKTTLNPIIEWTDDDVWEFIHEYSIEYCSLYDEGFKRLGCIGCPMANTHGREREFLRWPRYRALYINAFEKMLAARKNKGKDDSIGNWKSPLDVYNWWMQYANYLPGQVDMLEDLEEIPWIT